MGEEDGRIRETFEREATRLRRFIRSRVPNADDAEDILQDAFYELVLAYRLTQPIEQAGAWLYRVVRNRIVDRFRRRKHDPLAEASVPEADGDEPGLDDLLP